MTKILQITSFYIQSLRIAGFLEFLQQVVKLCKAYRNAGNDGTSRFPAKVDAAFTPLVSAVSAVDSAYQQSRASDYSKKIADEDTRRDNLYKALKNQVQMYLKFDFDAEMKEAGEVIWNVMKKYNVNTDENYSEESVKLQQMLQEMNVNYQVELRLKKLGLETLVKQLEAANEAVRTMMSQRNDERMYQVKAALATARKEADEAYRYFVLVLNAAAVMDDNENRFDELISQVNELIKYYRQYVLPKKGGSGASDEDDSSESDDSSSVTKASEGGSAGTSTGGTTGGGVTGGVDTGGGYGDE